jgi:hypothetical protein
LPVPTPMREEFYLEEEDDKFLFSPSGEEFLSLDCMSFLLFFMLPDLVVFVKADRLCMDLSCFELLPDFFFLLDYELYYSLSNAD